jgi:alkylation response protein AidB-like acyl-CoA dehydrogenase
MNMQFTEEQRILRESVAGFARRWLPPGFARECDESGTPPIEQYKRFAELGFLGVGVPEEFGGMGGGIVELTIIMEELAKSMLGFAIMVYQSAVHGSQALLSYGSEDQQKRFIPRLVSGDLRFCFSLSEPDAGSDAASLRLRATRDDNGDYVLNGSKMWSSSSHTADYILVAARTSTDGPKHKGISLMLVDTESPGLAINPIQTLGQRAIGTNEVSYDNVKVPVDMRVGDENQGWYLLQKNLERERLLCAAYTTGAARAAFEQALEYSKNRVQFGQPIGSFQAIQHKFANMAIDLHLADLLVRELAELVESGGQARLNAAMTKVFCTEMANRVAYDALQVFGGYGYAMDSDMQLLMRDVRIMTIAGGSSEIMRNVIAKELGLPR